MSDIVLTALVFDTPEHADEVAQLVDGRAPRLPSWVTVAWDREMRSPRLRLAPGAGTSREQFEAFWHVLVGLTLFGPLLDAAAARPAQHAPGVLGAIGIDELFINRIRDAVSPGTSALLMLSTPEAADLVYDRAFDGGRPAVTVVAKTLPMATWRVVTANDAEQPDA